MEEDAEKSKGNDRAAELTDENLQKSWLLLLISKTQIPHAMKMKLIV